MPDPASKLTGVTVAGDSQFTPADGEPQASACADPRGLKPSSARPEWSSPAREPREDLLTGPRTALPDQSVYLNAARASLPRWRRIVGLAPWLSDEKGKASNSRGYVAPLYEQQAATLAIALLCELDRGRADRSYLREHVRASLTRWQLSLRGDGRPVRGTLRRSPLHGAILWYVVQLLSETTGFETRLRLSDIARHLEWLAPRPPLTPWLEAATIGAMADGAVLVRDARMLRRARERLQVLLDGQDQEGWFPERGGADIGRLSLTVDALARAYRQNSWEELEEPLQRAVRFLTHFVHPDGSVGGCYGSCETAFLSPYGLELLAADFEEAFALALMCRRRWGELAVEHLYGCEDDQFAVLGASLMLAAVKAAFDAPATCDPALGTDCGLPYAQNGTTRFPHAGLTIFITDAYHAVVAGKKGGAIRITWRDGATGLDDPGVSVIFAHGTRTSSFHDAHAQERGTDTSVTSSGALRRSDSLRITNDRHTREITFGEDWIRIRDRVRCRLPCRTIVCQSPSPARIGPFGDPAAGSHIANPPIFVDGGRSVEITRLYRNGKLMDQTAESHFRQRV